MFVPDVSPFPSLFSAVRRFLLLIDNKAACHSSRAAIGQSKYPFIKSKKGN